MTKEDSLKTMRIEFRPEGVNVCAYVIDDEDESDQVKVASIHGALPAVSEELKLEWINLIGKMVTSHMKSEGINVVGLSDPMEVPA